MARQESKFWNELLNADHLTKTIFKIMITSRLRLLCTGDELNLDD